jgi:hypothetical protein
MVGKLMDFSNILIVAIRANITTGAANLQSSFQFGNTWLVC